MEGDRDQPDPGGNRDPQRKRQRHGLGEAARVAGHRQAVEQAVDQARDAGPEPLREGPQAEVDEAMRERRADGVQDQDQQDGAGRRGAEQAAGLHAAIDLAVDVVEAGVEEDHEDAEQHAAP